MTCILLFSKIVFDPLTLKLRIQTAPNFVALNFGYKTVILQVNPVGFLQFDTYIFDNVDNFVIFSYQGSSQTDFAFCFDIFFYTFVGYVCRDVLHFVAQ